MVGKSHPTVYNIIREFMKEAADTAVMTAEIDLGRKVKQPQRAKYRRINARLQALAEKYEEYKQDGRRMDYIRACGHNVSL